MKQEEKVERPVRLTRVLCATPSCESKVPMSKVMLGPIYCPACLERQQQRQEEG